MSIEPYKLDIARRLLIQTADENYIMARHAFFLGAMYDFYWLSMHAMEKYYKAIVVLNGGRSPRTHNLVALHAEVMTLEPRLPLGRLVDPAIENLDWFPTSFNDFLELVTKSGSADNRYGIYGFSASTDTIVKMDQLVWALRRCCRPFTSELTTTDGNVKTIDEVQVLIDLPDRWSIHSHLAIERLVSKPEDNLERQEFLRVNFSFPGGVHKVTAWKSSFQASPLSEWFGRLTHSTSDTTKSTAADVMDWVVDNIVLNKQDKDEIKTAVAAYRSSAATNT
ncbi:HEPN domain-containing protein [Rhizobium sullae]|uniref:HEPN domain-containing protein n=1 Tax=Rhizobium sullae TaxID=50338 RepID=A0A4R3PYX9_RHISU|nr:HEPN domain-containing protein [Rhizobium sullae]TCU13761.1 HEPN domain-containing protein [Rhizobium sullae]